MDKNQFAYVDESTYLILDEETGEYTEMTSLQPLTSEYRQSMESWYNHGGKEKFEAEGGNYDAIEWTTTAVQSSAAPYWEG
jgi:hypothetical protein